MRNTKYLEAAENLVKAIDIAIGVLKVATLNDFREQDKQQFIFVYSGWKDELINPQPQYANMTSLKYSIDEVFTYFQEGNGQTVEKFWEKIKEAGLPYKRENKLVKILKRKRIKDDIEYDFVIDVLVPYQEEGLINADEVALLNQWIGDFEKKETRNNPRLSS